MFVCVTEVTLVSGRPQKYSSYNQLRQMVCQMMEEAENQNQGTFEFEFDIDSDQLVDDETMIDVNFYC